MWGANNEPVLNFQGQHPATWKWATTSSATYYSNVNAAYKAITGQDLLNGVILFKRPVGN